MVKIGKGRDAVGSTLQNLASLKGRRAWVLGTALAGAIAIALTSGVNPTRADNTPVSTPVAVASPEATVVAPVIPTPAATASAVATPVATLAVTTPRIRTNSVVRGRGTGPSPCIQASAVAWQDGQGWSGGHRSRGHGGVGCRVGFAARSVE